MMLLATMLVPLLMLAACIHPRARAAMPMLLGLAPLPGLAAALLGPGQSVVLYADWLRLTLALDAPAALLLGVAALLWSAAGVYCAGYIGRSPRFAAWWLITLSGSLGVFIAGDLVTFYLAFAMVSLAAWGLVVQDGTPAAYRAGAIYILLAVLGEVCLLLGFALLAVNQGSASLAIADAVAALAHSPWRLPTTILLIAGFGLKAGLVPLHVWLPLAHPAAPMPASAVLSGAIIKAGVIGLIRFLPADGSLAGAGGALAALGFLTAFWGVACGIVQANPKTVLAYSSVSQMGVVAAALGMGLVLGDPATPLAVAFYAAHHVLAKGALFLGVGVAAALGGRRALLLVLLPALVLALGFGGLPLTGGALAKAAVKAQLGAGVVGWLAALSAAGSTLLMLHFVRRLAAGVSPDTTARAPALLLLPWLGLATAAVAVPWVLYAGLGFGDPLYLLGGGVWPALWPVLLGGALALALARWGSLLPRIPEGDVIVLARRGRGVVAAAGTWVARAEAALRVWPNAGLALLGLIVAFGAAMLAARP